MRVELPVARHHGSRPVAPGQTLFVKPVPLRRRIHHICCPAEYAFTKCVNGVFQYGTVHRRIPETVLTNHRRHSPLSRPDPASLSDNGMTIGDREWMPSSVFALKRPLCHRCGSGIPTNPPLPLLAAHAPTRHETWNGRALIRKPSVESTWCASRAARWAVNGLRPRLSTYRARPHATRWRAAGISRPHQCAAPDNVVIAVSMLA